VQHLFNYYLFVNDRLRQLLREEVMNVHQPILPTIIIVVPNALGIQVMNPSISHTTIPINYQATWS